MRFNVYLVASSSFSTIFLFKKILSSVGIEFNRSTFQTSKYVDKVFLHLHTHEKKCMWVLKDTF